MGQSILYDPTRKAIAYQTEIYTPLTTLTKVKEKNYKDFEYKYKTDSKDDYIRYRGRRNQLEVKQLKPGLVRAYNHRKKMPPIGMVLASKESRVKIDLHQHSRLMIQRTFQQKM